MGGSRAQKRKRGKHGRGKVRTHDDGTPMSRLEVKDLVEQRRLEKKAAKKTASKFTVEQLLEKAEEYLDTYEYEMAQKFCRRALQLDPDHVGALELSGNLLAELGDGEGAKKCFGRAITVCPEEGFTKYMYMGQLHEGLEAVQFFQKGVELMERERDQEQGADRGAACSSGESLSSVSGRDISTAYCSIAEIFLTDACFEEDSEQRCKAAFDRAVNEDPGNPEAHQLLASYWLSNNDKEQAKASIERSMLLWEQHPPAGGGDGEEAGGTAGHGASFESRIGAAKLLMELELFDTAEGVLHALSEEDDEVVQIWYMLGLLEYERKTEGSKPPARYYLHKAKKLYCALSCDDEQVLQHIDELLTSLGPGEGDEDGWMEKEARREEEDEEEAVAEIDSEASSDEDDELMEH